MDYSMAMELSTTNKTDKISTNQVAIDNGKSDKGMASLKEGQQITGTVLSVEDQITLNFDGHNVVASGSVIGNAKPGDVKTFEVVKVTESEIELKLLDGNISKQSFKALVVKDADWGTILTQKSKVAQKAGIEVQYKETKTQLEVIGAKLTELDYRLLEAEGFPVETFTVSGLYHALNRIKSEAMKEQPIFGKAAGTGEEDIAQKLKEADLPVTAENMAKITKALDLSHSIIKIDDKAMHYLILRGAKPSIENIYKASFSGTMQKPEKLTEQAWSDLENQVEEIIKSAGYEVSEENLGEGRWLIENQLPLTTETFTYKKDLDQLKSESDTGIVLDRLLEGMKNGTNPMEVSLITSKGMSAEQIVADIRSILPEAVTRAVKTGTELTIKNLLSIQESLYVFGKAEETTAAAQSSSSAWDIDETSSEEVSYEETLIKTMEGKATSSDFTGKDNSGSEDGNPGTTYEEVRARRQMEEIRLKMNLEAANQLEKKGIKVETQQLSRVVDALRELEDNYYKQYLKEADAEVTGESLQILKETTRSIEQLRYIPSYILGSTLTERTTQTIPELLSEGRTLQARLEKAGTAYETLMTVPNREYGDSIKKAFAHMDSLLTEMNIENSVENQRAVRILGYNQMEISEASINQVKAYDHEVATMIKNLHPEVTVRMIREGINPLETPISELNRTIDRIKEEQGITAEEKYSTYLRQLEKADGITAEERKAYIGIYRLLYNVEKSDGAALGAVVKAGQEITLEHLLTAVQTSKKGRLDAAIDDEFGALQSLTRAKESIAEQLSGFHSDTGQQYEDQSSKEDTIEQQTEYLERILRQVKEELTPNKLSKVGQSILQEANPMAANAPLTAGVPGASMQLASIEQPGMWEAVKDVPVDTLLKSLQKVNGQSAAEEEVYTQKVQEIRDLCRNSEQSIRFLQDYQVPSTTANIMIANNVLSNGESPIKKLLKLQKENFVEKSENSLKELNELSDTISDKHSMQEIYSQLKADADAALNQSYSEEKIDSIKLAELKTIGQQMTFIKTLTEKEYYQIPVETEHGVTNINLTILRGTKDTGKVSVTIWSEQLGNVKAEFSLKEKILKGLITSDSRSGLEQLKMNAGEIEAAAAESEVTLKQLDFSHQRRENDTYSYQNQNVNENTSSMRVETERTLYRLAKAIVHTVRSAESSGS